MAKRGRSGHAYRRLITLTKARPDAWICCRCHLPIDPDIRWPDKRCWSLDHLTPLELGGSLLDPANAAGAHLSCNARHGQSLQHRPIQSRAW